MNACGFGVCEALCVHSIDQFLKFAMQEAWYLMARMPVNLNILFIVDANMFVFLECVEPVN